MVCVSMATSEHAIISRRVIGHLPGPSDFNCPRCALGRSRPAADAAREVAERWLLYGCDVSVGHRRVPYDPFAKNDVGRTPTSKLL
jgi:hypothetical protein